MKYNMEKVLYLASTHTKDFNVSLKEAPQSDLSRLVLKAVKEGWLSFIGADKTDKYYVLTKEGHIKLLELQLKWRQEHGKSTKHILELLEAMKK